MPCSTHTKLAEVKGHQNWVKVLGEFLIFPGGGTQFIHGALHYIDFLEEVTACTTLQACLHKAPIEANQRGSDWPEEWPLRLQTPPYWLNRSQMGIYGKPAPEDFTADYEHWKQVVSKLYLSGLGISWSDVRNIMDMRAVYGGYSPITKM